MSFETSVCLHRAYVKTQPKKMVRHCEIFSANCANELTVCFWIAIYATPCECEDTSLLKILTKKWWLLFEQSVITALLLLSLEPSHIKHASMLMLGKWKQFAVCSQVNRGLLQTITVGKMAKMGSLGCSSESTQLFSILIVIGSLFCLKAQQIQ